MNGKETPWHQDIAYPVTSGKLDPARTIRVGCNFWMPLQDVTLESGCMQFVPSSNHAGVLPHRTVGGDPKVHTLEVDGPLDTSTAVACPIPAGGCTIHGPRTLHYTGPNNTANWRRAWILFFGSSKVPKL
jgi:ectoine hydroxylase-related dioxygenase (phytanoyl-CoA dioxygenase family)